LGHRQQAFLFQPFYSHLWAHNLPDVQKVVFWLPDIAKKMYCNLYRWHTVCSYYSFLLTTIDKWWNVNTLNNIIWSLRTAQRDISAEIQLLFYSNGHPDLKSLLSFHCIICIVKLYEHWYHCHFYVSIQSIDSVCLCASHLITPKSRLQDREECPYMGKNWWIFLNLTEYVIVVTE
jgi:hypothetical protein